MNQLRIYAYQLIDPNYICNAEWAKILKNSAILEKSSFNVSYLALLNAKTFQKIIEFSKLVSNFPDCTFFQILDVIVYKKK